MPNQVCHHTWNWDPKAQEWLCSKCRTPRKRGAPAESVVGTEVIVAPNREGLLIRANGINYQKHLTAKGRIHLAKRLLEYAQDIMEDLPPEAPPSGEKLILDQAQGFAPLEDLE